ncbi:MAG: UDP-N-acetylglucosamine 2-epimerase (non-hydrolyzing) [Candidatus Omnitrophica bacterium]|nr:UDP-N-acetylglucosamine 2-epimerase (non-hydrolyzing) [Candidatus Omnitrophota bacterium]
MQSFKRKKRVLVVFGTRPEAVKLAPVIAALKSNTRDFAVTVCVTAQHRHMLDQVLTLFGIRPDIDLDLMTHDQTLAGLSAKALTAVTGVLEGVRPDWVLVQGDTTTAMIASLAAFYQKIPVAHVEAGLRTLDPYRPFPEEMNRRVIGTLAQIHFAPTGRAVSALRREGVSQEKIFETGNTVVDALQHIAKELKKRPVDLAWMNGYRLVLVTAHRRENFDEPLANICQALAQIAQRYADVEVIYPVHLNPNVSEPVKQMLGGRARIRLIPPVEYREMVYLMKRSYLILTDSGGVQEEAPALGKPVLVMRDVTERPEGVDAGVARLVGTDTNRIVEEVSTLLEDPEAYARMARAVSPYGDGRASKRIAEVLRRA